MSEAGDYVEAVRQAHVWITDALESTGDTDDELLEQPGTLWVRLICARDRLADAIARVGA